MNETEVAEAVAAQREHEKRSQSCQRVIGRSHTYRSFGRLPREVWRECTACGVTETHTDYLAKGVNR